MTAVAGPVDQQITLLPHSALPRAEQIHAGISGTSTSLTALSRRQRSPKVTRAKPAHRSSAGHSHQSIASSDYCAARRAPASCCKRASAAHPVLEARTAAAPSRMACMNKPPPVLAVPGAPPADSSGEFVGWGTSLAWFGEPACCGSGREGGPAGSHLTHCGEGAAARRDGPRALGTSCCAEEPGSACRWTCAPKAAAARHAFRHAPTPPRAHAPPPCAPRRPARPADRAAPRRARSPRHGHRPRAAGGHLPRPLLKGRPGPQHRQARRASDTPCRAARTCPRLARATPTAPPSRAQQRAGAGAGAAQAAAADSLRQPTITIDPRFPRPALMSSCVISAGTTSAAPTRRATTLAGSGRAARCPAATARTAATRQTPTSPRPPSCCARGAGAKLCSVIRGPPGAEWLGAAAGAASSLPGGGWQGRGDPREPRASAPAPPLLHAEA